MASLGVPLKAERESHIGASSERRCRAFSKGILEKRHIPDFSFLEGNIVKDGKTILGVLRRLCMSFVGGNSMRFFTVIILNGMLCLFYFQVAQSAEVKVVDNNVFIETDAYQVQFTDGVLTHLYNKLTEETYTLPLGVGGVTGFRGRSGLLKRDGRSIWTDQATLTEARKVAPLKAEIVFRQGQNALRLFIGVDARSGDLLIEQEGTSDTAGVYGIQWGCVNLNVRHLDLILPAEGGQVIDATTPITSRDFHYPGSCCGGWEAQLAIIQGQQGGFFVRGADETFQFKALHYKKDIDSFALGFETQNQAPFNALTSAKSVIWRLNTYTGDWRVPARQYQDWMERTFKPWRLDEMPTWVQDIGFVLTCGLDTEVLNQLAEEIDPTKTLLYVVGWRRDGYDRNYPDYTAKPEFGQFVEAAHQHGFRVMPHVNLVGVSTYHPSYAEFQKYQYRSAWTGNLDGWEWEKIGSPTRFAYINLASSSFRKFFVQQLKAVWEAYKVDAFHLDISHIVPNDANGRIEGLNFAQGNARIHKELAEALPGVVFSGEGLHEVTFFRESFAQRGELPPEITPHPISSFLFFLYTLPYGHLGLGNPDRQPQRYQMFLDSYESWGVLPTVRVESVEELNPERFRTQEILSVARAWQQLGLKPDFESDWESDTLFQYIERNGETVTLKTTDGGTIFHLPQEGSGYERVFGVTQVKTDRSLPHWHAYNETEILGLNPNQSYFFSDIPRDFSQVHINALPKDVFIAESRVTNNAAFFLLERVNIYHEIDLLSQFHLVRTGIVVDGEEVPRQKGATFHSTEDSISGIRKSAIDAHPPWQSISGDTFGEWTLSLPDSTRIRLEFDIGLAEGSENSDGVTFVVSVQGDEIFRRHHTEQRWQHISMNLTSYRGQHITLRFTTNPGPSGNTSWDWARWGEPKILSEPSDTPTKVGFFLPREPIRNFPDTIRGVGQGQYVLNTKLPAQILFLFPPAQQVVTPYNLRDTEFVVGLQFDNVFQFGNVYGSGNRSHGVVGGVQKETIDAHPPYKGQTLLQFLLSLSQAEEITFSFSMGLLDENARSNGVTFEVFINGQQQFKHFTKTPGWTDVQIPLSEHAGETVLLELVTDSGGSESWDWAHWADLFITAKGIESSGDVNQDGSINILDIILVAQNLGQKPPSHPRVDANRDGQVNILDLVFIAELLGERVAAAPSQVDIITSTVSSPKEIITVQRALRELEAVPEKSPNLSITIQFLRLWLENANRSVSETRLLPNYPNPFNPETWIPYQLAETADVSIKIYDISGRLVRTLSVGFKPVGYYLTRERAAYWDGRNETGESVSSGVYFLRFVAGNFTATQRLVIVK